MGFWWQWLLVGDLQSGRKCRGIFEGVLQHLPRLHFKVWHGQMAVVGK